MGVKSTIQLTREQAEQKYLYLLLDAAQKRLRRDIAELDNSALEAKLEIMNDSAHDGEGFENYTIV